MVKMMTWDINISRIACGKLWRLKATPSYFYHPTYFFLKPSQSIPPALSNVFIPDKNNIQRRCNNCWWMQFVFHSIASITVWASRGVFRSVISGLSVHLRTIPLYVFKMINFDIHICPVFFPQPPHFKRNVNLPSLFDVVKGSVFE